jgi:RNA polymerase sigma factor (sigma-70 family)
VKRCRLGVCEEDCCGNRGTVQSIVVLFGMPFPRMLTVGRGEPDLPEHSLAERLCDRYYVRVYRYVLGSVKRPDLAVELTQEVFLRIVRGLRHYKPMDREAGWVFTIARRVLATNASRSSVGKLAPEECCECAISPATQLTHASLGEALEALSQENLQVLHLREIVGLGYGEIAEATGLSVEAVRSRLARIRRQLARTVVRPSEVVYRRSG